MRNEELGTKFIPVRESIHSSFLIPHSSFSFFNQMLTFNSWLLPLLVAHHDRIKSRQNKQSSRLPRNQSSQNSPRQRCISFAAMFPCKGARNHRKKRRQSRHRHRANTQRSCLANRCQRTEPLVPANLL